MPNRQSPVPNPELDALVRRVDEDRWLASRFGPTEARARLVALYAVNYEIARTAEVVREPALGDIRLAWWRDGLAEMFADEPVRKHEALAALASAHKQKPFTRDVFEALLEARRRDLDAEPFETWEAFNAYVDATAGGLMRLAADACGLQRSAKTNCLIERAGWLWGALGLLRAEPVWRARGRSLWPRRQSSEDIVERISAAQRELRSGPAMPAILFPALGYVANARAYFEALQRNASPPSLFARQVRMIVASATGRL